MRIPIGGQAGGVCFVSFGLGGFLVGEVTAVSLARVIRRPFIGNRAARVLPGLPRVVPMKAKLGQNLRNITRLFIRKLYPNPLSNHFRKFKEIRCFAAEQSQ